MRPDSNEFVFLLIQAGQACLDWARDMGECHLCSYDVKVGIPHDTECPLNQIENTP